MGDCERAGSEQTSEQKGDSSMGMTITIRIERTELDPQGLKELLAMTCENLGYGVRVVRVEDDRDRKEEGKK